MGGDNARQQLGPTKIPQAWTIRGSMADHRPFIIISRTEPQLPLQISHMSMADRPLDMCGPSVVHNFRLIYSELSLI